MATFLVLTQRLFRELGRTGAQPTGATTTDPEYLRLFDAVNDAWVRLQGRDVDWKFMRKSMASGTLVLNTTTYTGSALGLSDFGRWRQPYASDGGDLEYTPRCFLTTATASVWRLNWLPLEAFKQQYLDGAPAAGLPIDWSISDANEMLIGPKPDSANYRLKAEYKRQVLEMTADGNTPTDLPSHFHTMLVWRALIDMGTFDAAQEVIARAQRNYAEMEGDLLQDQARGLQFGDALA